MDGRVFFRLLNGIAELRVINGKLTVRRNSQVNDGTRSISCSGKKFDSVRGRMDRVTNVLDYASRLTFATCKDPYRIGFMRFPKQTPGPGRAANCSPKS